MEKIGNIIQYNKRSETLILFSEGRILAHLFDINKIEKIKAHGSEVGVRAYDKKGYFLGTLWADKLKGDK